MYKRKVHVLSEQLPFYSAGFKGTMLGNVFFSTLLWLASASPATDNQCASFRNRQDYRAGWDFFRKGETFYVAKRDYLYSLNGNEGDEVNCTKIFVSSKDPTTHEASVDVTYYDSTANEWEKCSDVYRFSKDKRGYNKLKPTTNDSDIGGAFIFAYANEDCAVLQIDVASLPPKDGAQIPQAREEDAGNEKTEVQKTEACFMVKKLNAKSDLLSCCDGMLLTECRYRRIFTESEGNCPTEKIQERDEYNIRLLPTATPREQILQRQLH